jgi:hypothetical protein
MSTVRFERKGDLLSYVYFTQKNTSTGESVDIDENDISKVELLIGGQVIDEQDSTFSEKLASKLLVSSSGKAANDESKMYALHFSFCENWQSALPLVSLQYHDVELRITWATIDPSRQLDCWANFIYLDTQERQELASMPQNMLIHQTQKTLGVNGAKVMELNFNHPVKFLCSSADLISSPLSSTLKLQLNGTDVSNGKLYDPHFRQAPFYFHCPFAVGSALTTAGFLQPFCLETNKLQPTGSLNFSRLDSARMVTDSSFTSANVYAVNYNILRIQNGMGGLMYAN